MSPAEALSILVWIGIAALASLVAHSLIRDYVLACAAACGFLAVISVGYAVIATIQDPAFGPDEAARLIANLPFALGPAIFLGGPVSALLGVVFLLVRRRKTRAETV